MKVAHADAMPSFTRKRLELVAFLKQPTGSPDPEGSGQGCPPFSDRAMDGEYENAEGESGRRTILFGEAISFW
jgi:hypothetical protein